MHNLLLIYVKSPLAIKRSIGQKFNLKYQVSLWKTFPYFPPMSLFMLFNESKLSDNESCYASEDHEHQIWYLWLPFQLTEGEYCIADCSFMKSRKAHQWLCAGFTQTWKESCFFSFLFFFHCSAFGYFSVFFEKQNRNLPAPHVYQLMRSWGQLKSSKHWKNLHIPFNHIFDRYLD